MLRLHTFTKQTQHLLRQHFSTAPFGHLTPDQVALKDASRAYFMNTLNPLFMDMDDTDVFPDQVWPALGEQGYMGLTIPPKYGGAGLDYLSAGLIAEEMHYANASLGISHSAHDNLCANNIYLNGTEEQRSKYLPNLCKGTAIGALGMSEPGAGSDAIGSMAMRAVKDGDRYILNGTKMWITNGPVADVILLYAKTNPEQNTQGVSAFLIETKNLPGFSVGKKQNKMGFRGSPQSELIFEDCIVHRKDLLGQENQGVKIMMSGLDLERAWVSIGTTGVAERALDLALVYAKERTQFQQPICNFQLIQDKLARMYTALTSAQLLCYKALEACNHVERGESGRGEIHKLSASAFMAACYAVKVCCDEGVQIFGGMGYMRDMEINALYRTIKTSEIAGGSMEIRKLIVAKELLEHGIHAHHGRS